jgi:hypothetical protein
MKGMKLVLVSIFVLLTGSAVADGYIPGTRLLVFCDSAYMSSAGLRKLLSWTYQRGYEYRVIYGHWPDAGFADTIHKSISNEYRSHNPPLLKYVLFVGDANNNVNEREITLASGGDYWYTLLEDDDLYPEVGIARVITAEQMVYLVVRLEPEPSANTS